jgi:hypothetical protein
MDAICSSKPDVNFFRITWRYNSQVPALQVEVSFHAKIHLGVKDI